MVAVIKQSSKAEFPDTGNFPTGFVKTKLLLLYLSVLSAGAVMKADCCKPEAAKKEFF
jgi:hypothetical protein